MQHIITTLTLCRCSLIRVFVLDPSSTDSPRNAQPVSPLGMSAPPETETGRETGTAETAKTCE